MPGRARSTGSRAAARTDGSRRAARRLPWPAWHAVLAVAGLLLLTPAHGQDYELLAWDEPEQVVDWEGSLGVGATYAQAEAESYNLSLQAELKRITRSDRWSNRLLAISGRSDGSATSGLFELYSHYRRDIRKRWLMFLEAERRHDQPANLRERLSVSAGVGYRLAEGRRLAWLVMAGLGHASESFYDPLDIMGRPRTSYRRDEALLGTEMEFDLFSNLTVSQRLSWYPNLSYGRAWRLTYDASARAAITRRLSLDVTASWRRSTEPGRDRRPDEVVVITGLALRLD